MRAYYNDLRTAIRSRLTYSRALWHTIGRSSIIVFGSRGVLGHSIVGEFESIFKPIIMMTGPASLVITKCFNKLNRRNWGHWFACVMPDCDSSLLKEVNCFSTIELEFFGFILKILFENFRGVKRWYHPPFSIGYWCRLLCNHLIMNLVDTFSFVNYFLIYFELLIPHTSYLNYPNPQNNHKHYFSHFSHFLSFVVFICTQIKHVDQKKRIQLQ